MSGHEPVQRGAPLRVCPRCAVGIAEPDAISCPWCRMTHGEVTYQDGQSALIRRRSGRIETFMRLLPAPASIPVPLVHDLQRHESRSSPGTDHLILAPQVSTKHRRLPRGPLYRRALVIIPMVFLVAVLALAGVFSYKIDTTFNVLQHVSTPPSVVPGSSLGSKEGVQIDTGPARAVLAADRQDANPTTSASGASNSDGHGFVLATLPGQTGLPARSDQVAVATPGRTLPAITGPGAMESKGINILLMGVDARPGEAIDIGVRPDVLAVLHLNETTGSCRILSIPRDTRVNLPGYGLTKINHALAVGGIPYEQQVVEDYLGIKLDHYGLIDFSGVTQLVDAVGGVIVVNPAAFTAGGFDFDAGTLTLDGSKALAYARYRGDSGGDFGRIGRQQQIIHAVMTKLSGKDMVSIAPKLLGMLDANARTDLGLGDILGLARTFTSTCTADTLETVTLAGTISTYPDPMLKMDLSYVIVDPAELRAKLDWLLADR